MVQSAHILAGATIAVATKDPGLAVLGALASHYILDLVPHKEYAIEHLHKLADKGQYGWSMIFELLKGVFDVFWAFMVVVWLTDGALLPFFCGIVAIIPDMMHPIDVAFARWKGLPYPKFHENPYEQFTKGAVTKFLSAQRKLHYKMHLLEREFVPRWMGLTTQISAIFASVAVLFLFGATIA